ncbi:PTS sugar transporter subunit IIA [Vagococcus sp. BWB3-3]|uniref:PTS sugar transporter subunit IIA n=1 Tax=Vagococcus allomyrinae TaxID=2794353 RepID=A0A940SQC4_9ENTE|nr:PTS sugar transporter subunit IIA [Vagococcus allomyrinae]MBP1039567.1 PTS sugar transporter subunit IIA [Vagococcus allomyrinae]
MIGVLIATHGKFAEGILDSVELIMGKQENCQTLSLCHGNSIEDFSANILMAIKDLDRGAGVIIFTDLFSASPYNQTALNHHNLTNIDYRLISGVNLPMLIEAFNQRMLGSTLEETTHRSLETGMDGIKEFFTELNKQTNN